MSDKRKLSIISFGILLVLILIVFISQMGIRGQLTRYLEEQYSGLVFDVGFVKIDPIYGKFYAKVTCLEDYAVFPISKGFKSKDIYEDYPGYKSRIQYNSRLRSMFDGSNVESSIKSITGGGKIPYQDDGIYDRIYVDLTDEARHISVIENVLNVLKKNNISAETIVFIYEKNKHVYEIQVSSDDYDATESEIEARVFQRK